MHYTVVEGTKLLLKVVHAVLLECLVQILLVTFEVIVSLQLFGLHSSSREMGYVMTKKVVFRCVHIL